MQYVMLAVTAMECMACSYKQGRSHDEGISAYTFK